MKTVWFFFLQLYSPDVILMQTNCWHFTITSNRSVLSRLHSGKNTSDFSTLEASTFSVTPILGQEREFKAAHHRQSLQRFFFFPLMRLRWGALEISILSPYYVLCLVMYVQSWLLQLCMPIWCLLCVSILVRFCSALFPMSERAFKGWVI